MGTGARSQTGRNRAREHRLKAAQDRRLQLDPDQVARDKPIDEATVDVEAAWEGRAQAERAVVDTEAAAAACVPTLRERERVEVLGVLNKILRTVRGQRLSVALNRAIKTERGAGKAQGIRQAPADTGGLRRPIPPFLPSTGEPIELDSHTVACASRDCDSRGGIAIGGHGCSGLGRSRTTRR